VFQNAHQYGDIIFPLGKALLTEGARGGVYISGSSLRLEVNPMAKIAYGLYRGQFLNAVERRVHPAAVGNRRGGERVSSPLPGAGGARGFSGGIPANPEALQLGLKAEQSTGRT